MWGVKSNPNRTRRSDMSTSKSKSHAERTELADRDLKPITEQEATQTVGGCGTREGYLPTSDTGPYRPVAI